MDPEFDRLKELARSSPGEFEKERIALINELIQLHQNATRAHGEQWRIDMETIKAKTPLGACVRLSSLMWKEFYKLEDELQQLIREVETVKKVVPEIPANTPAGKTATIIPFKRE